MFAALYGDVAPHAWWGPELDQDAYSLFHSRARATQWLDETEDGAPGLWGMNDAGWQHLLPRADLPLAAWFQVEVQAVAANRPLPVQPFLQCAGETVARAGTLRLDAVQVLLPIQGMGDVADSKDALAPSLPDPLLVRRGQPRIENCGAGHARQRPSGVDPGCGTAPPGVAEPSRSARLRGHIALAAKCRTHRSAIR